MSTTLTTTPQRPGGAPAAPALPSTGGRGGPGGHRGPAIAVLKGLYTLWLRDLIRFWRDRTRIIASFAQPILFLFVFGAGLAPSMGQLVGTGPGAAAGAPGISYVQFMFPGIIAMAVLFTALFSAISVVWDREFGFLKEVLVAPLPRWVVAVGKALGGSTTAMIQGLLMLVFAPLVGVSLTPLGVLQLLPLMFLTAFALSSLGLLIAARLHTMESFQVVMNFLMMPLFFLSGALFPLRNLPPWLSVLTQIDPVSYGTDAVRQVVLTQAGAPSVIVQSLRLSAFGQAMTPLLDMAVVAGFALLMLGGAVWAFSVQD